MRIGAFTGSVAAKAEGSPDWEAFMVFYPAESEGDAGCDEASGGEWQCEPTGEVSMGRDQEWGQGGRRMRRGGYLHRDKDDRRCHDRRDGR